MSEDLARSQREFLSRTNIEERVSHMLDYVLPNRGNDTAPPDLQKVVDVLDAQYGVHFSFSDELGDLPTGERILGMFSVDPLTIRVTSYLPLWYISRKKPLVDTTRLLKYRETAELSDLGWVEWQANEFSMCLILPRRYLQMLVCAVQMDLGIRRNLGTMYLDDQQCNKQDCQIIVGKIVERSSAKQSLLWRRLRFLGILEDHQRKSARPVFESLDALFEIDGQQTHGESTSETVQSAAPEASHAER